MILEEVRVAFFNGMISEDVTVERLPKNLVESLPVQLLDQAECWWRNLSSGDRKEIQHLCDQRKELFLFEMFGDSETERKIEGGKFLPGSNAFGIEDWGEDYFQHLLDHPELILVYETENKIFHIGCTLHSEARDCFSKGKIHGSFNCPFQDKNCRIKKIIGNSKNVFLRRLQKNAG